MTSKIAGVFVGCGVMCQKAPQPRNPMAVQECLDFEKTISNRPPNDKNQ
jgi:hypothetical protein